MEGRGWRRCFGCRGKGEEEVKTIFNAGGGVTPNLETWKKKFESEEGQFFLLEFRPRGTSWMRTLIRIGTLKFFFLPNNSVYMRNH